MLGGWARAARRGYRPSYHHSPDPLPPQLPPAKDYHGTVGAALCWKKRLQTNRGGQNRYTLTTTTALLEIADLRAAGRLHNLLEEEA